MRSEILTWRQLSQRASEGARVLLGGELVTVRNLGSQMDSGLHKLTYLDGAKMMRVNTVRGSHLTAVLESGTMNQEEGQ